MSGNPPEKIMDELRLLLKKEGIGDTKEAETMTDQSDQVVDTECLKLQRKEMLMLYLAEVAESLEQRLERQRASLRRTQIRSIEKLIRFFRAGKYQGLIKQPMGAGKTRLYSEILASVKAPALVLVPRTDLLTDSCDQLVGSEERGIDGLGYQKSDVHIFDGTLGATERLAMCLKDVQTQISNNSPQQVIIMTYQSLLSLAKKNPEGLEELMNIVKLIISDEAHRSLGDKTFEVFDTHSNIAEQKDEPNEEEEKAIEEILSMKYPHIHLRLTATPKLGKKEVEQVYGLELIDSVRIQELVEDGTLVFPRLVQPGTATYTVDDENVWVSDEMLKNLMEEDKFRMEDGRSVSEAVIDSYIIEKEKAGGYLPGVAFCGTIKQAEQVVQYLQTRGIRAVRSTSADAKNNIPPGVSGQEARLMINKDEIDMVVTVSKVGEGWDVPTLRAALWMVSTKSPARKMQGTGRIMRSLNSTDFPAKNRENTVVLEPEWLVVNRKYEEGERSGSGGTKGETKRGKRPVGTVWRQNNLYDLLYEEGEVDHELLTGIVDPDLLPEKELSDEELRALVREMIFGKKLDPETWADMSGPQRLAFKLTVGNKDYGLYALSTLFGISGNPKANHAVFFRLGKAIFQEQWNLPEQLTDEEITLHAREIILQQYTPQTWADMSGLQRSAFKLTVGNKDYGLYALSTLFGISGNPNNNLSIHLQFGKIIFGEKWQYPEEEIIIQAREMIFEKELDPQKWATMSRPQRSAFKLTIGNKDYGLWALCTLFGISGNPVNSNLIHLQLGKIIFRDTWNLPEQLSDEKAILKAKEMILQDLVPKKWADMSQPQRSAFKLTIGNKDYGLRALSRLFGICGDPIGYHYIHLQLGRAVFQERWNLPEQLSKEEVSMKALEIIINDFSTEKWASMEQTVRRNYKVKINGKIYGLVALAGLLSVPINRAYNYLDHLNFGEAIFGTEAMRPFIEAYNTKKIVKKTVGDSEDEED